MKLPGRSPFVSRSLALGKDISMRAFITRLIWLCVLPPLLLATWVAVGKVENDQSQLIDKAKHVAGNLAFSVDQSLLTHVSGLKMLSLSPLIDDRNRWPDLYREAQGFEQSFGTHVILADAAEPMQMLLNTRVPFGSPLPVLPKPKGQAAAPTAVATGRATVGDTFVGPVAKEPLIAIAVPVVRQGKTPYVLLTTIATGSFQRFVEHAQIPENWSIALVDSLGKTIARRTPPGLNVDKDVDAEGRIVVALDQSPWSVVLEVPRHAFQMPFYSTMARFAAVLLIALIISLVAGKVAARRLVSRSQGRQFSSASPSATRYCNDLKRYSRLAIPLR